MWEETIEKIGNILAITLSCGVIFFFSGCGNVIKMYNPEKMEYENWSPFRQIMINRSDNSLKIEAQAKLIEEFYNAFPNEKKSYDMNKTILSVVKNYCNIKTNATTEAQIFTFITERLQYINEKKSLNSNSDNLSLIFVTIFGLANIYICPDKDINTSIVPEAPKIYLAAVKQQDLNTKDINTKLFHQKPNTALLLNGYNACSEMHAIGYKQALEFKREFFSNKHNINLIYNTAHKYLCPNAT